MKLRLKLQDYGVAAEILTGIAVVISLIVLIAEVSANTRATERRIAMDYADQFGDIPVELSQAFCRMKTIQNDTIPPQIEAFMIRYDMSCEQADQVVRYLFSLWRGHQADYRFGRINTDMINLLRYEDQRLYWAFARDGFDADFTAEVERRAALAGIDLSPPPVVAPIAHSPETLTEAVSVATDAP